jgi:hypothetical protein
MDIDPRGETQNPSTEKIPMQQIGLGIKKPQVQMNEYDDEWTESDEVQHCVVEPTQQSEDQVQVEEVTVGYVLYSLHE